MEDTAMFYLTQVLHFLQHTHVPDKMKNCLGHPVEKIYDHNVLGPGAPQTIHVLTVRGIASQTQTVREVVITSVGPPA